MSLLLPQAPPSRLPDPQPDNGNRLIRRAIAASAMGNAAEWYDYGVYAAVATYLTEAFFPEPLGSIGTMLGFAVSFVLRPLGGMVWGAIGDRIGRKSVLVTTILLIASATTLMGVLPTYATAGAWAPLFLIILRVVQGFSAGGEYGGAATFIAEYAPDTKRGRYGCFLEFGTLGGFVFGNAVVLSLEAMLSHEQMVGWGWRVPFFVALPLGLIGLVLRSRIDDTPVFKEFSARKAVNGRATTGFVDLVSTYARPVMVMFAMVVALNVTSYTLLTYQPTYLHATIGLGERSRTTVILVGELVMMACIPFAGALSDRIGRKPMWRRSMLGLCVLALPMYWLMGQGFGWAIIGFAVLGLLFIPQLATVSATFPAMFPTQVRYAGFAISYNVATTLFGGTAPLVADTVIDSTGWRLFPAVYLMLACAIGLAALPYMRETAGCSIRGTDIPGVEPELERELARIAPATVPIHTPIPAFRV
ncbi:MFS transporter [Mycobacterium talmoniae]|uniref:Putative proline/betaine transporter n=1 Tax=Mycobacterium talmoniae TaxID=1858794 RepID=A0A1S1NLZ0_9MYCO|nr:MULTISPECIES: MFS transporter [Mycobacterium]OHV03797.1 MFS transporter [Mycobacterium talmoniae]PQM49636.1 Proline/betaine transporter [Mycobacterium talmoniae]TDH51016.1 MFS transporter [Mycobacterium eburneum]